jgi:hypothetical protein
VKSGGYQGDHHKPSTPDGVWGHPTLTTRLQKLPGFMVELITSIPTRYKVTRGMLRLSHRNRFLPTSLPSLTLPFFYLFFSFSFPFVGFVWLCSFLFLKKKDKNASTSSAYSYSVQNNTWFALITDSLTDTVFYPPVPGTNLIPPQPPSSSFSAMYVENNTVSLFTSVKAYYGGMSSFPLIDDQILDSSLWTYEGLTEESIPFFPRAVHLFFLLALTFSSPSPFLISMLPCGPTLLRDGQTAESSVFFKIALFSFLSSIF